MWKRILAATDLTGISRPALETALKLARENRATLFVLHVDDVPGPARNGLAPWFEAEVEGLRGAVGRRGREMRQRLSAELRSLARSSAGVAAEPIFKSGRPAETIVTEAHRLDADLIVLGSRGTPLGSVSERVMMLAGRPVLVVPAIAVSPIAMVAEPRDAAAAVA